MKAYNRLSRMIVPMIEHAIQWNCVKPPISIILLSPLDIGHNNCLIIIEAKGLYDMKYAIQWNLSAVEPLISIVAP